MQRLEITTGALLSDQEMTDGDQHCLLPSLAARPNENHMALALQRTTGWIRRSSGEEDPALVLGLDVGMLHGRERGSAVVDANSAAANGAPANARHTHRCERPTNPRLCRRNQSVEESSRKALREGCGRQSKGQDQNSSRLFHDGH